MDSSSFQDTVNTDPELTFDDLPMPFKMLDKLLWSIFEETWNLIETKEKYKSEQFNFQQSCLQQLDVNVDIENIHIFTIVGQYLFKIFENQIIVYDVNNLKLISEWKYLNGLDRCSIIRTFKTIQYDKNVILQLIINDSGQIRLVMFVEGLFIPIKQINLPSDGLLYHALNGKISPCGKYFISLNEDSINSKIWLEVYRLPVDAWMKEILPIVQEFQNEITVNLIERKSFYENQLQLSSPMLLGRIKYPVMPPSPACKSVTAALKQANDKANLLSYSNLGAHLYSDAINEANQLTFIEHRNYPSCLTALPKSQLDEKNSVSVQGFTESPESTKQISEPTTERSQAHSPSSIKHQTRNTKSSKRKQQHKEQSTNGRNNKKAEKINSNIESTDALPNKDNDEKSKKKNKTIDKKQETELDIEINVKDSVIDETERVDDSLKKTQQNEEIRRQLVKDLNEAQPKCYPYFEFLPISLTSNSKQSEISSFTNLSYSGSICVYWSRSCYIFFYPLDKFSKTEEGVIEEIRYFGSEITYISVIYASHSVNTHETFIDDKENLSKKPDLINSRNNYLVIGLQSRLVIIKQLQSGRYLPLFYNELGSLVDAGLLISTKYINLLTACYVNGNKHSTKGDLILRKKFTFDIYNLDENQLMWKKTHIVGKKNFNCQAVTILTVDDNFNIVVCLVSSKDLLVYPLDHQQNCLHHQQLVKHNIEIHQSNQVVDHDLDQFCQRTVSLFPEVSEQWVDNVEFYHQLCLTSRSTKSTIQEVENDSHVNHEERKEKLNGRQGIYQLWIRGTKIEQENEDRIQSKLFRVDLEFKPLDSLELNNEENYNEMYSEPLRSYSNKLLIKRSRNETVRRLSFQKVWEQFAAF
ncbi:unnamed protein product [Schistosoma margrebowiei]|uniref:Uncharacterized protein n=1 Tax=Schistosoma margrebowiei TaxID=48269 RepID=A0AA85AP28_9TREM|nr:unnamed protein product [Schistosoma margrebowiei]